MARKPRVPSSRPSMALQTKRAESRHGSRILIVETTSDDPDRLDFVYTAGSMDGVRAHIKRVSKGRTNPRHCVSHWEQDNLHPQGGELLDRFTL